MPPLVSWDLPVESLTFPEFPFNASPDCKRTVPDLAPVADITAIEPLSAARLEPDKRLTEPPVLVEETPADRLMSPPTPPEDDPV